jgi:CheY-like chemotaxis protein
LLAFHCRFVALSLSVYSAITFLDESRYCFGTAIASFEGIRRQAMPLPMAALSNTLDSKILVIDDNQDVLSAMSFFLEMKGFSIRTAHDGLEGLDGMRADDHISLVLLDLWMPVMDGWEFLRHRANDPRIAKIPVIVISAVSPDSIDSVQAVLQKPVHPEKLMDAVTRHALKLYRDLPPVCR